MSLIERVNELATAVANHLRDQVAPRLTPTGGAVGQVLTRGANSTLLWSTAASGGGGGVEHATLADYSGARYQYLGYPTRIVRLDFAVSPALMQVASTADVEADWPNRTTFTYL